MRGCEDDDSTLTIPRVAPAMLPQCIWLWNSQKIILFKAHPSTNYFLRIPRVLAGFFALWHCNAYLEPCNWWRNEDKIAREGRNKERQRGRVREKGESWGRNINKVKKLKQKKSKNISCNSAVACLPLSLSRMVCDEWNSKASNNT